MKKEKPTKKLCKHCKTEIPYGAKICPHCRKKQKGKGKIVLLVIVIIIILLIIASSTGPSNSDSNNDTSSAKNNIDISAEVEKNEEDSNNVDSVEETSEPEISEEDYKAECKEYAYKDVMRNPSDYIGEKIKITVKVSSVHEKSLTMPKYYFAYSNDEYDWWMGDRYGLFEYRSEDDFKILEDDIITVYGEIAEPQETESAIVNSEEVFCIDMKYADLIKE